jgi:ATP-dependent DNA helicase DinG
VSEVPAVSGRLELTREVDAAFADGGALAESIEQFEPRDGQRLMARRVAETLTGGGVLLAEAGTGTGKTLAYLVPAILSRHRVMVSTGTKNLQEQIYFKDLPVLQGALGVDFTATYMKGRANYLCLHRYGQAPPELVAELDAWVRTTETGDRAELEGLPDESAFWNDVSANVETCLGSDCPQFQDCFVTRMRQRAAASDIVIVNHHLLCADAAIRQNADSGAIPDCHHLVLDEAHQLEDVATQFFGRSLSNYRLDELVRDADRLLNAGVIADEDSEMRRAIAHVSDHARAFFGSVGMMLVRGAQARSAGAGARLGTRRARRGHGAGGRERRGRVEGQRRRAGDRQTRRRDS